MRLQYLVEKIKSMFACVFACAICIFLFVFFLFPFNEPKEPMEEAAIEKEYYLYSTSSQAKIQKDLSCSDCLYLCGLSTEYQFSSEEKAEKFAEYIIEKYRAKIVDTENSAGVVSYYCSSPKFGAFIAFKGEKINFHIAVRKNCVKMGTPIIFGGY